MYFVLGETDVIITKLQIRGLHGIYDYDLSFNNDLTFIFGENGCGKTTILNIVSSIVTGRLYSLFDYRFDEIMLYYLNRKTKRKEECVHVISVENRYEITIDGPGIMETIPDVRAFREVYDRDAEYALERRFFTEYKSPNYLRKAFNYIYLPLSRNSRNGINTIDIVPPQRKYGARYSERDIINKNYLNDSLRYIEELVRDGFMRISTAENAINLRFRRELLASSLDVTSNYDLSNLTSDDSGPLSLTAIENNRKEYVRILKSIGEWNEDMNSQVDSFFSKYIDAFKDMQNVGHAKKSDAAFTPTLAMNFLLMTMGFNRIKQIAGQAQAIEKEKEKVRSPMNAFLTTVNNFLSVSEDKKHIEINPDGRIVVTADSPKRRVSLYHLSSGEKQIIIIFACLIFGLTNSENGIYIIDEPEASLHLAWQRMFVKSIRNVNSSIQLIFATHAPEIIGQNSDRAVKLKKHVDPRKLEKAGLTDE